MHANNSIFAIAQNLIAEMGPMLRSNKRKSRSLGFGEAVIVGQAKEIAFACEAQKSSLAKADWSNYFAPIACKYRWRAKRSNLYS